MIVDILDFIQPEEINEKDEVKTELFRQYAPEDSGQTVFAVDGGVSIIIDGGTWSIAKIRIADISYKNSKKTKENTDEYVLATMLRDKKLRFKIMPSVNLFFEPNNTDLDEFPNLIRSILEWLKIKEIAGKNSGAIILRDGAFSSTEAYEKAIINNSLDECEKMNCELVGVCKTSRQSTSSGRPFVSVLKEAGSKIFPESRWLYQDADLSFIRFHQKSVFCYRIESLKKDKLIKTVGTISYYSMDPELLGYPYPLLKVDKIARVKNFEKELENIKIKSVAKAMGKHFVENDEMSTIMHSLLDKRAYR